MNIDSSEVIFIDHDIAFDNATQKAYSYQLFMEKYYKKSTVKAECLPIIMRRHKGKGLFMDALKEILIQEAPLKRVSTLLRRIAETNKKWGTENVGAGGDRGEGGSRWMSNIPSGMAAGMGMAVPILPARTPSRQNIWEGKEVLRVNGYFLVHKPNSFLRHQKPPNAPHIYVSMSSPSFAFSHRIADVHIIYIYIYINICRMREYLQEN